MVKSILPNWKTGVRNEKITFILNDSFSATGVRAKIHSQRCNPVPTWPVNFEPYLVVDSEVFHQYPTEIAVRFRNTPPFNANITYDWEIKDENGAVVYGVSRSGYTSRTHHFRLPNNKFSFGYTVKVTVNHDLTSETATKTVTAFGKPGKYRSAAETRLRRGFYLSDHLGNVRATIDETGEVLSQDAYYPFGTCPPSEGAHDRQEPQWRPCLRQASDAQARYKYNGKELDEEHGLNWLAYGARYYDPEIGRWHVVDPLAENSLLNPFNYVNNSPIKMIDPDGKWPFDPAGLIAGIATFSAKIQTKLVEEVNEWNQPKRYSPTFTASNAQVADMALNDVKEGIRNLFLKKLSKILLQSPKLSMK